MTLLYSKIDRDCSKFDSLSQSRFEKRHSNLHRLCQRGDAFGVHAIIQLASRLERTAHDEPIVVLKKLANGIARHAAAEHDASGGTGLAHPPHVRQGSGLAGADAG